MKQLFVCLTTVGILASSFSAYGENATFDYVTGKLHIPAVEVMSGNDPLGLYQVDMQQENDPKNPFSIIFKVNPISIKPLPEALGACLPESDILERVRERGSLLCGGRTDLPGFGYFCPDGRNCGFDIDLCRAVAAAVLNSPTGPITVVPVSTGKRKEMLQNREVDILSRNASWTSSRDIQWGHFTWTMFYDGQGFMVLKDSGITEVSHLGGKRICVVGETTTHNHLMDYFARYGWSFTAILASETPELIPMLIQGKCEAVTTDRSGLFARRTGNDQRDKLDILNETISREPLTPVVPHGDQQWFEIVKIVMFGLINAEMLNITKDNVDAMMNSDDPEVQRLLGVTGSFGQEQLDLEQGAIAQAIRAVGNYGEIYDRHLGPNGIDIPRRNSLNRLWRDGGLIYAPPMR